MRLDGIFEMTLFGLLSRDFDQLLLFDLFYRDFDLEFWMIFLYLEVKSNACFWLEKSSLLESKNEFFYLLKLLSRFLGLTNDLDFDLELSCWDTSQWILANFALYIILGLEVFISYLLRGVTHCFLEPLPQSLPKDWSTLLIDS